MEVIWTREAVTEITNIAKYITKDNPPAATALVDRIFTTIEDTLPANPKIGRPGRVVDTREYIIHPSYIVVYTITAKQIVVLTVRHTAQLWPDSF